MNPAPDEDGRELPPEAGDGVLGTVATAALHDKHRNARDEERIKDRQNHLKFVIFSWRIEALNWREMSRSRNNLPIIWKQIEVEIWWREKLFSKLAVCLLADFLYSSSCFQEIRAPTHSLLQESLLGEITLMYESTLHASVFDVLISILMHSVRLL